MALRIRELRKSKNLSQQELGEMAGISRSQVSEIESESKPANTRRLQSIADALEVGIEDLFDAAETEAYRAVILDLMKSMEPDDRQALIKFARSLAAQPKPDSLPQ